MEIAQEEEVVSEPKYARVIYGVYSDQIPGGRQTPMIDVILTKPEVDQLWSDIKGAVSASLMHFEIHPIDA